MAASSSLEHKNKYPSNLPNAKQFWFNSLLPANELFLHQGSCAPIRRRHVPEPDADEQLAQLDPSGVDHADARGWSPPRQTSFALPHALPPRTD